MNQLEGTVPESFWKLSQLESLFLHENNLYGTLPNMGALHSLGSLYVLLQRHRHTAADANHRYMYANDFSGTLPESLGQLRKLQYVYVIQLRSRL